MFWKKLPGVTSCKRPQSAAFGKETEATLLVELVEVQLHLIESSAP